MSRMKWDSEEEMTDFGGLNGSTWQLKELEQMPENDAVYTLNVRVQDMAGNPNSPKIIIGSRMILISAPTPCRIIGITMFPVAWNIFSM